MMRIRTPSAVALDDLIDSFMMGRDFAKRYPKPGSLMSRIPAEMREKLVALTSDDIANIRPDVVARYI